MKGETVRNILKEKGYIFDDIAKSMGISPQSLNSKLKTNDIKVGVLEEIASSINKSIDFFFDKQFIKHLHEDSEKYGKEAVNADVVAEKVYNKLLPHIDQILNRQVILEAALAKLILENDKD